MQIRGDAGNAGLENDRGALTRAAVLAEITRLDGPIEPVRDDEVTIQIAAAEWGCSMAAAQRRLDGLVEAGQLTRRRAMSENWRYCWAYRLVA